MVTRVKICGVTNAADVAMVVDAGVDAIGFNMYPSSPRYVAPALARQLCAQVPVFVSRVGLFVNASQAEVEAVCRQVEFDLLQFHGDEDNDFCASFGRPLIKALRVAAGDDAAAMTALYPNSHGILLDAYADGLYGGTGRTIDWQQLTGLALGKGGMVLAGGLTADNVAAAITLVRPHGVDVSGGVERAKGHKAAEQVRRFMRAVRATD